MRYFTRAWASGELSDVESLQTEAAYRARLTAISDQLTPALTHLAKSLSLHDGLIESAEWDHRDRVLRLSLVCGDSEPGYFLVQLVYRGVHLGRTGVESLRRAALSRETEVLNHEVDQIGEGLFAHRLLFWPTEEVTIEFEELELTLSPRRDRRVSLLHPFIERERSTRGRR